MSHPSKQWSYRQLTEMAEGRIRQLMEQQSRLEPEGFHFRRMYEDWAWGVYLGWLAATEGYTQPDDKTRLEAMTKPAKPTHAPITSAQNAAFSAAKGAQDVIG
jgi:hypothetical protein